MDKTASQRTSSGGQRSSRRLWLAALAVLMVAGLIVRLQVCRELLARDVQVANPSAATDMHTYRELSEQLLRGEYRGEFYYQPFYYAVFLTALKRLFGYGPWPVLAAQSLLSALTIWLAGMTAARLWGRVAGLAAGVAVTFSTMLIFYCPYHLLEILQAFWVALIASLTLGAWRHGGRWRWATLGAVLGAGILTRGNLWFFAPGLVAAAAWREATRMRPAMPDAAGAGPQHGWRTAVIAGGVVLGMALLVQLPFAAKNSWLRGRLSGPSTATGAVLGLGNSPEAPPGGREPGSGPGPMEYPRTYQAWGEEVAQVAVLTRIRRWAQREPTAFLELQWRKLLLFWDAAEIPNNIAWEHQGVRSPTLRRFGWATTGLMMALALTTALPLLVDGCRRLIRRRPRRLPHPERQLLLYLLIAYWLATAAFYILARFRVPAIPLFAIFAGATVGDVVRRLRHRRWKMLLRTTLPAAMVAFLTVYLAYDLYRFHLEVKVMRWARPCGIRTELAAGSVMLLDHGPLSFGGWQGWLVRDGMAVEKRFILAPGDDARKTARLILPLAWETSGRATLEVNGVVHEMRQDHPGMIELELIVPVAADGLVRLRFAGVDARLHLLLDHQRHYRRTLANGDDPGAELVAQLILAPHPNAADKE